MKASRERILLVESDPDIVDLVARQTLGALGYAVKTASAAGIAIQETAQFAPDVILVNLQLPGLSGKDLLAALDAQNRAIPVIVIAQKGREADILQAFRLGASDYLTQPLREAEIVQAVERALQGGRARRERESLAQALKASNAELEHRLRELTTIFALGKAVTSITNQQALFEKLVEGAMYIGEADSGWLLARDESRGAFLLAAQRGLPKPVAARVGSAWDDGLSSLVALSGEPLVIHGEPLGRFKVAQWGKSALVVPLKLKKEVIGLLALVRKADRPFTANERGLIEAVADYGAISLVNTRLFRALEERAGALQQTVERAQASEKQQAARVQALAHEWGLPLHGAADALNTFLVSESNRLNTTQKGELRAVLLRLQEMKATLEKLTSKPAS
jgi:two-component system NtrC family sensor kinase